MKKKLVYLLIFILILINGLYLIDKNIGNETVYDHIANIDLTNQDSVMLVKDDELSQEFIAKKDGLKKIKIYLKLAESSGNEYLTANVLVGLKDEKGNVICEYKFEKVFFDNEYSIDLEFPEIKKSKDKKYTVYIKSFKSEKLIIPLGKNIEKNEFTLTVNDEKTDNSLLFRSVYKEDKDVSLYYILFISIIFIFTLFIFIFNLKKNLTIEKKYLFISIFLSIMFIVLTPIFNGQDEISHWARIYELSNGKIVSDVIDDWPQLKVSYSVTNIGFNTYDQIVNKLGKYDNDYYTYVNMEYTSVYSPISYIPHIIGLKIGKLLTNIPFFWAYISRLFEAIFCIICVYYAIKIIPFAKEVIFIIALLPSYLLSSSLLSADSMLISCSLLFIAKILELIYDKKSIKSKDYILLTILAVVISISKLVYAPICLLLLFIPYKKKNKQLYKNVIIIIFIAMLITLLWNLIALRSLTSGQGVNTIYLIKGYIKDPLSFIEITLYTFYNGVGNFVSDIFGGRNDWFGTLIIDATIIPQVFMLMFLSSLFKSYNPLEKKEKIFIFFIILITYLLISTSLLISCTPVYYKEIIGIQGRYFIPLLFLIYLCFPYSNKKKNENLDYSNILLLTYLAYFLSYYLGYM